MVIWDRSTSDGSKWNYLPLGPEALDDSHGFANCVAFGADNDFVYARYQDGTLLKWPVSLNVIQQIICDSIGGYLSESDWKEYTKGDIERKNYSDCETMKGERHQ